jgi:hypothetical protein
MIGLDEPDDITAVDFPVEPGFQAGDRREEFRNGRR